MERRCSDRWQRQAFGLRDEEITVLKKFAVCQEELCNEYVNRQLKAVQPEKGL